MAMSESWGGGVEKRAGGEDELGRGSLALALLNFEILISSNIVEAALAAVGPEEDKAVNEAIASEAEVNAVVDGGLEATHGHLLLVAAAAIGVEEGLGAEGEGIRGFALEGDLEVVLFGVALATLVAIKERELINIIDNQI